MGYRLFPNVNRIGRPKAVTSIPILQRQYRQLPDSTKSKYFYFNIFVGASLVDNVPKELMEVVDPHWAQFPPQVQRQGSKGIRQWPMN